MAGSVQHVQGSCLLAGLLACLLACLPACNGFAGWLAGSLACLRRSLPRAKVTIEARLVRAQPSPCLGRQLAEMSVARWAKGSKRVARFQRDTRFFPASATREREREREREMSNIILYYLSLYMHDVHYPIAGLESTRKRVHAVFVTARTTFALVVKYRLILTW